MRKNGLDIELQGRWSNSSTTLPGLRQFRHGPRMAAMAFQRKFIPRFLPHPPSHSLHALDMDFAGDYAHGLSLGCHVAHTGAAFAVRRFSS